MICRLAYTQVRREQSGIGWETDYPYAEINLSTRFSELTRTRISRDTDGSPNYYVVRATDDTLFNCPVIVAYGTYETPEFQRQNREFTEAVKKAGKPATLLIGEGYNHFEMTEMIGNPLSLIGSAVLEQMKLK